MAASSLIKEVGSQLHKMSNSKCIFAVIVAFVVFSTTTNCAAAMKCTQTDSCSCKFDNGSVVSLKVLLTEDIALHSRGYLTATVVQDKEEYYYQPCIAIDTVEHAELPKECTGMASCQLHDKGYYANGLANTANFTGDPPNSPLKIMYTSKDRTTEVTLICDPTKPYGQLDFVEEKPEKYYRLKLTSFFACAKSSGGLSGGSILLILFFVFAIVYLVGGVLFMRCVRGAQNKEVIPNVDFWTDLPYLIRDGFRFVANGCQSDQAYDQI